MYAATNFSIIKVIDKGESLMVLLSGHNNWMHLNKLTNFETPGLVDDLEKAEGCIYNPAVHKFKIMDGERTTVVTHPGNIIWAEQVGGSVFYVTRHYYMCKDRRGRKFSLNGYINHEYIYTSYNEYSELCNNSNYYYADEFYFVDGKHLSEKNKKIFKKTINFGRQSMYREYARGRTDVPTKLS